MPGKRLSLAAGLRAQGSTSGKAPRSQVGRPLVACVRAWGGAAWVFAGLMETHAKFVVHLGSHSLPALK